MITDDKKAKVKARKVLHRTAGQLLVTFLIFEGHVMPNEDAYQKSVWTKFMFRCCVGVSEFSIGLLIICILAEEIEFEIGHFCNFRPPRPYCKTLSFGV